MFSLEERLKQANSTLAPYAVPYEGRLGRKTPEPSDETRFEFQRDRDRIVHAHAFRRLQGKTQVFVAGEGDHYRTRLTHTLEVAQIARDIARALALNEDLAECIALAHDLGHPPFGHAGEDALDQWMKTKGSHFEHNEQSFRIITVLEKRSSLYIGLNVNQEVEEGLVKHSAYHPTEGHKIDRSLESVVADIADEIAYTSHDSDDGLLADIFSMKELASVQLAAQAYDRSKERGSYIRGSLVHLLVKDLLEHSLPLLKAGNLQIGFSDGMRTHVNELREFLSKKLYIHPTVYEKAQQGQQILLMLCAQYEHSPTDKILNLQERTNSSLTIAIKDYVAGMTDTFAWTQAAEHGLLPA